ncbi:MAG: GAF domain-containing protein [Anaerolineae bacterium]|nr:GAF domain-containing protein [Anaerolineae bacterium]
MSATTDTSRMSMSRPAGTIVPLLEARAGLWLTAAGAVIVVLAAVFYLVLALGWRSQPFPGVMLTRTLTVDASLPLGESWAGLDAGLQAGDHIVGINGETFPSDTARAAEAYDAKIGALNPGDTVTVMFERPTSDSAATINNAEACEAVQDGAALCSVSFVLATYPQSELLAGFVVPFVSGLITLGIGIAVLVLRTHKPSAQVVTAICLTTSLFMLGIFDLNTTHQLTPLWMIATTFAGAAVMGLAFAFPVKLPIAYRRPSIQWLPAILALMVAGLILASYYSPATPQAASTTLAFPPLAALVGAVFLVIVLLRRREAATSPAIRDQSNTVLIGMLVAVAVGIVWLIILALREVFGYSDLHLNTAASAPFLILPPLSMAYALLHYRSLNTDRIISHAFTYTVMLVALLIGYFLLIFSASLVAGEAVAPSNPILLAILVFLTAALFVPVRSRLQDRVDQVYFRRRLDYQRRLEVFNQRLSSLIDFGDILNVYRAELDETLQPKRVFLFLPERHTGDYAAKGTDVRFTPESPLVESLSTGDGMMYLEPGQPWNAAAVVERSRLMILDALLLAGLHGANRLIGFVSIAPPRSMKGTYTFEELRFVQALTTQISVAVERAEVVDSLEHRVRELDVLSQVSQAVNFTIELDDVLELIYAQTIRLIDATHFYIALRVPETNELYHAFFLENGERYTERENLRWSIGSDLFSEIVRSGQPMWVSRYADTLTQRGTAPLFEDPRLKAWMGVPMLAGSQVIGALAAGTTEAGKAYTMEQRRIFTDIGALAATSLDKARLFAETNIRARQLAALNDITRQIVAAELDLEKLLQLITASATDILGAAAGSLLLTVDDGSGDLEFRVAVGGSGEELIGSRLPAGRGLVGEVAATGEPVIVNDVSSEPRWGGELRVGAFHTFAVLAVPLISQSNVVGVLEVINKLDGGSFTTDDVDLLTAFAGQAAVAIENARLFQMTDLQLSERVGELETLERIDVELNRSLDLAKVAEITLNSALKNTGATAGLIGMVIGEPPRLDVIYRVGYGDGDLPAGVDGDLWPLERGIVSRVLRSRQAELVPDVRIDPDYIPSLRGALSQITLPMLSGGMVNAIIVLETNMEPRLKLADMPFLQRLAEHASIAIANAQLYAELARANQSKSEFVSFVAHELKNPLTSIRGYADVLLGVAGGAMSDQQKTFLSTIRSNADRMNTLVSDLNDVTKLQTDNLRMEFAAVSFADALADTLPPLQKQIDDKAQRLEIDMPDNLPLIHADQSRLIQALTNLISNANKYTPPEGVIRIAAQVVAHAGGSSRHAHELGLQVSVTDTGIGMDEEDLMRLFTPYFRSENPLTREQPGTGLGLTITRGIVERHNGEIRVESEPGVGTTFTFTIPLAAQAEQGG